MCYLNNCKQNTTSLSLLVGTTVGGTYACVNDVGDAGVWRILELAKLYVYVNYVGAYCSCMLL